jgi:hypothetical protein
MFKDVYLSFKINTHEVTINLRRIKYLTKRSEYKCEVSVIDLTGTIAYSKEFGVLEEGYFVKVAKIDESIYSYIENFLFKILYQLPINKRYLLCSLEEMKAIDIYNHDIDYCENLKGILGISYSFRYKNRNFIKTLKNAYLDRAVQSSAVQISAVSSSAVQSSVNSVNDPSNVSQ